MGNTTICGGAPQQCVDECARLQFETRSRDPDDPDCDPAGTIFNDTLQGLVGLDKEALRFASTSNLSAVRWLLSMGASTKAKDRNSTTMLHAACRSGSCLIVQELVKQGVPLDAQDSSGWTPLHIVSIMGRRDLALLLLRVRASVNVKNKKGTTPLMLCSDPGTKEVLEEFSTESKVARPHPKPFLADMLVHNPGGNNDDYTSTTCEPFFVPRLPLCRNELHRPEVTHLGLDLFRQSAGHGLAFFVATGIVHDHPTDLSQFLLKQPVDPVQLGEFLGEEFSLAQTLRLAYIHSVDVTNTGVVGALRKAFNHMRAPLDLGKIDRIVSAVAYLWWRQHDAGSWDESVQHVQDSEELDWSTVFAEDCGASGSGGGGGEPKPPKPPEELAGMRLRQAVRSVEGLRRLMFSTVMLAWNIHRAARIFPGSESPRRMSLAAWLDMNLGIEADGTNLPIHLQKSIYQTVLDHPCGNLLPAGSAISTAQDGGSGGSGSVEEEEPSPSATALAMQDSSVLVKGWASIPRGGLERHEPNLLNFAGGGMKLAQCVFSETSNSHVQQLPAGYVAGGQTMQHSAPAPADDGEAVWLSLRMSLFLFLSTSPTDAAPYAFVRLQDAVVRDVNRRGRSVVLAGRPRVQLGEERPAVPAGDLHRQPLPLCFLLADGRFQPFEAQWLELQFSSDEELEHWAREVAVACNSVDVSKRRAGGVTSAAGPSFPSMSGPPPQQPSAEVEPLDVLVEDVMADPGPFTQPAPAG
mmetsp:Transcript_2552/g.7586  ORF Transcript_2552/g.7586 Transcript_2552/m.7586 type:complete len:749 (-) Transcript_2552:50-2296(-)|eukprot:CAMPEP_0177380016 /NCGR_PEP_ID=MMETSP0368-20130122/47268_1 /TAXON_ID=447022 ORGANISM="Scrippsiella hangoei-like, Strain SHHI-4" /NCGR_SAMPLE_ID=MMETSP0368 /ASSEMBLY_ACC=CAM_ASM_000363 /LENGTH=748 /DNA_ID=CAMNT_0018844255 /DNA_START=39 /DNA_END=2285 /DNA_ORIENTATION=+